jgi:hypothetical protein
VTTPEGRVKNRLKRRLAVLRQHYSFWPVQMGLGARTLDVLICAGGVFIAIEVKRPGADLTEMQKETQRQIERAHGLVFKVNDDQSMEVAMDMIRTCCDAAEQ